MSSVGHSIETRVTGDPALTRAINQVFDDWQVPGRPGGWVAVVCNGNAPYLKSFGQPCIEQSTHWRLDTRLRIFAITMSMTAMAMLVAEDGGRLSLDDDVRDHLRELPDYGRPITLRNLLDHSSGLRDNEMVQFLAGFVTASPCSIEYTLELIRRQTGLNFDPGTQTQFSNTNYRLLALILERATGISFADWLKQTIFDPLNMRDSIVVPVDGPILPNLAFGYTPTMKATEFWHYPNMNVTTGDGGVVSSIRDLIAWDIGIRTNALGIDRFLERLTQRRRFANGDRSNYGLGVRTGEHGGHAFLGHGGEYSGYSAEFIHFTEVDLSVIIMANYLDPALEARLHRVAEIALGSPAKAARRGRPSAKNLALLHGWYANTDLPQVVAVAAGPEGSFEPDLAISATLGGLNATSEGDFEPASGYSSLRARFLERPGRRPQLALDGGSGATLFEPVSPEYLAPDAAEAYVGLYGGSELNAVHRIYRRGDHLFHLRGLGEWPEEQVREMRLVGADLFVLDYAEGQFTTVRFERGRRGKVRAMTVANRDVSAIRLDRLPDPISSVTAVERPGAVPIDFRPPTLALVGASLPPDIVS